MMDKKHEEMDRKQALGVFYVACRAHQMGIIPIFRNKFGSEALGPCLLALVLMVFWAGFTKDLIMIYVWVPFWLFVLLIRRIQGFINRRKGIRIHSHYDGFPCGTIRLGRTERIAKGVVEPLLVGFIGLAFRLWYEDHNLPTEGLPTFLLTGMFTLPFCEGIKQAVWKKKLRDIEDARIEQESLMRDYRDRSGF
jgi:hypothetical protein